MNPRSPRHRGWSGGAERPGEEEEGRLEHPWPNQGRWPGGPGGVRPTARRALLEPDGQRQVRIHQRLRKCC